MAPYPLQTATQGDPDDRRTPVGLFLGWHARYAFTVDAAASRANAKLPRFWTVDTSALTRTWSGERVWCNPPYSELETWVAKAHREIAMGCPLIAMLLPANRCEQEWWQCYIEPWRDRGPLVASPSAPIVSIRTTFLKGRTRFEFPEGTATPPGGFRPPFGCVLVVWQNLTLLPELL